MHNLSEQIAGEETFIKPLDKFSPSDLEREIERISSLECQAAHLNYARFEKINRIRMSALARGRINDPTLPEYRMPHHDYVIRNELIEVLQERGRLLRLEHSRRQILARIRQGF